MFIIEVRDLPVVTRKIRGRDEMEPFEVRSQQCLLHRPSDPNYPEKFSIALARDEAPKPPGKYTLSDENFFVDQYGELKFRARYGQLKLTPVVARPATAVQGGRS